MVDAERLELYVEDLVAGELERRAHSYRGTSSSAAADQAHARLEQARADVEAMRADTAARRRLGARWLDWLEPHLAELEAAERDVAQLAADDRAGVHGLTSDTYRSMPREARRAALAAMIDVVFVRRLGGPRGPHAVPLDESRVRVLWRGTGPGDLPAKGRYEPGGIRAWDGFEIEP
jgi:hypothetical protein